MTLLSKKLAELKHDFIAAHGDEQRLVTELNARLEKQDAHLATEIETIIVNHDARRAGLHALLIKLSARVGLLPVPASALGGALAHASETQAIDHAIDETEPLPAVLQRARRERDAAGSPISSTVPTH